MASADIFFDEYDRKLKVQLDEHTHGFGITKRRIEKQECSYRSTILEPRRSETRK